MRSSDSRGKLLLISVATIMAAPAVRSTPLTTGYTGDPSIFDYQGHPIAIQHKHVPSKDYLVGADTWRVALDPDPAEYLRGPDQATAATIAAQLNAPGWTFASSAHELSDNSLIVHWYEAVYEQHCVNNPANGVCVGANFGLEYQHGADDPVDVHWLQVVVSNHKLGAPHGTPENGIDPSAAAVYFDNAGVAGSTFFVDTPRRNDVDKAHNWTAYLFLVTGPPINADHTVTPGLITFYGGVKWGWKNFCVAPPGKAPISEGDDDVCVRTGNTPEPGSAAYLTIAALLLAILVRWRAALYYS